MPGVERPRPRRTFGRKTQANKAWVIRRDKGICGICGNPGADSLGHILPVATHPELQHDPDNWQAEHLYPRTREHDGFDCIGNAVKGEHLTVLPPSRDW